MAETKALTPTQKLSNTVASVQTQIDRFVEEGHLNLPVNYSAGNALRQAQLKIQGDEKLMNCSQPSLYKSMLDMVILGLNISKAQCYFIPYGSQAQLSVSYLGKIATAKRIDPNIVDITGRVVRDEEEFDFEDMPDGYSKILKHKRTLKSMNSKEIIGAYATITYKDGSTRSLIKTFDQIKQAWKQSRANPIDENGNVKKGSTHDKFIDDMCVKTCISAICKPIINTSDDSDLFGSTVQSASLNEESAVANAEAEEKMNSGDVIDVDVDFKEADADTATDADFAGEENF